MCVSLLHLGEWLKPKPVSRVVERVKSWLPAPANERTAWIGVKTAYGEVADPLNFELARTFFNSVTRRIFGTVGVDLETEFASLELASILRMRAVLDEPPDAWDALCGEECTIEW